MKAVILAANNSPRLHPFTETRAKSMIRIGGRYILEYTLTALGNAGVREVVIVVNHQQDSIRKFFGNGSPWGVRLEYVVQEPLSGIGHALKSCEPVLEQQPFLLVYGDTLFHGNPFTSALSSYSQTGDPVAVIALPRSSQEFGNVYLDHEMRITRLVEKPEGAQANYVLAGVFVLPPQIFQLLQTSQLDMALALQQMVAKQMKATIWEEGWIDIIYPWHILEANRMLMDTWTHSRIDSTAKFLGSVQIQGAVVVEADVVIEAGCVLKGPCFVGRGSYLGNNTLVRHYSAVGPQSIVGYGSELKNCVIFGSADLGRLSFIGDSVIGEQVQLGSGVTTVNHHWNQQTVSCRLREGTIDTQLKKVGAFVGDRSVIGARHTLSPGLLVPSGTQHPDNLSL
jgi:NDP-sugar pyrophosphorylase family protein